MSFQVLDFLVQNGLTESDSGYSVSLLSGGFWNDNSRVSGNGIDWVVKYYRVGQRTSLFPIFPEAESHALKTLEGAEIAPSQVAYYPGERPVLIYEFYPGAWWEGGVKSVAHLLSGLHRFPVSHPEPFRKLPVEPLEILAEGDELLQGADPDQLATDLIRLRPDPAGTPDLPSRTLVHTDVGAGNIISGPNGLRLIDWQCPGMGDPAEDVWAFQSPAFQILFKRTPLTVEQRGTYLDAYGDVDTCRRMESLSPFFGYRMAAYCCRRSGELATEDPELSRHYQRAGLAEIDQLETGLENTRL
jgi:thiamine kinase